MHSKRTEMNKENDTQSSKCLTCIVACSIKCFNQSLILSNFMKTLKFKMVQILAKVDLPNVRRSKQVFKSHKNFLKLIHGLQSLPPSPKRAERKGRRRPFREAGSGHKQWNTVSCVDTFSIISKFSAQNSKI